MMKPDMVQDFIGKAGDFFEHTKWLSYLDNKPLKCKITKVLKDYIYYRPYYGLHEDGSEWLGSCSYFSKVDRHKYMKVISNTEGLDNGEGINNGN